MTSRDRGPENGKAAIALVEQQYKTSPGLDWTGLDSRGQRGEGVQYCRGGVTEEWVGESGWVRVRVLVLILILVPAMSSPDFGAILWEGSGAKKKGHSR